MNKIRVVLNKVITETYYVDMKTELEDEEEIINAAWDMLDDFGIEPSDIDEDLDYDNSYIEEKYAI